MMYRFAYPTLLALLILVLIWVLWRVWKKPAGITYSQTSVLARLAGGPGSTWNRIPLILRTACLVLLILAAARPQAYNLSREIKSPGVDIILLLDTSGSMRALDFELDGKPVSRLTAVKKVVSDFIRKREMDRIGLVVFGEEAFTQSPLTLDKGLLLSLVERMEIGMAGDKTAVGSAVAIGAKRLKDLDAQSKVLILLTDGYQNAGALTPAEAAEAAHALGIKVYTIGVGGTGDAPFPVQTIFGQRIVRQRVDLDEDTLKDVARIGDGKYFRASDTKGLEEVYDIIDHMEKREAKVKEFFHYKELFPWFLWPALFLLGLEILVRTFILRVIP